MSAVPFLSLGSPHNLPLRLCLCVVLGSGIVQAADNAAVPATPLSAQVDQGRAADFTRICWNGEAEGQGRCIGALQANTGATPGPATSADWACSRDNAHKLVWSLRSVPAKAEEVFVPGFAQAGHDAPARCGLRSGWRLPTHSELAAIVKPGRTPGPMQQTPYFPNTVEELYWTSDVLTTDPGYAWGIMYGYNGSVGYYRTLPTHVRLVHDGH